MAENITSSPKPMSSTNAIDPIGQTPMNNPTIPSPSNLSHSSPIDIPQISSPSLSQISQHQQSQQQNQLQQHQPTLQPQKSQQIGFNVNTNLQQQQQLTPQLFQHQHQNIIGMGLSGLQSQQGMHRSASLSRMNHIQQQPQQDFQQQQVLQQQVPQQQLGMLRQTANVYGQMNFGGPVMSQQQHGQQLQQQLLQQSQQPQSQLLQQSQQPQSQQQQQSQQQSQQQQSQQQQLQQSQQQQLQQSQQQQLQHSQQQQSQQQQLQQSQQQQMQQSQHQQMQQSQHHQMQQSPQQPIQQSQQQQQQVHPQAQLQQSSQQQQPSQQQQQVQPQQMTNGNFSLSSLTGQSGHLPVLSSQAAAAQFNMLTSPRQRASIIQGSQLQPGNATGQTMQGLQALQMMGSLGFGSQIRANAPMNYGQQRINPSQLRQQLSQQNSLSSSQKLQGQTLPRTSSHLAFMNPQLSALSQNGQAMMQNTLSQQQQQWLKQMPSMSSPNAPSLRQQHQRQLLQQQMTSSSPLQQNMSFNPQQLSHLVQQQSMGHPQLLPQTQSNPLVQQHQSPNMLQAHQQPNQILQQQQSLSQQQQQPQKMHGLAKSMSLTVSQPDANLSGTTAQGGSSSQGTEATNQLLGKRKIQDLVSQVNPRVRLDDEVQDILLYSADDFIDSVVSYACKLAKHRKSSILEAKDVLLHLERNWHLTLPGYSAEDKEHQRDTAKNDVHRKRLDVIRKSMESSQREEVLKTSDSRDTMRQGMMVNVSGGNNVVRPLTPDLDQLQSISGPQSHQQVMRFDGS